MTRFESLSILIGAVASLGTAISAVFIYVQIKSTNDWNRRKTSQEILTHLTTGKFVELFRKIRDKNKELTKTEIQDKKNTYLLLLGKLDDEKKAELEADIVEILNILETISLSIRNKIIDESITYKMLYTFFIDFFHWALPYINKRREIEGNDFIFCEYAYFVFRWEKRLKKEKDQHEKNKLKNNIERSIRNFISIRTGKA